MPGPASASGQPTSRIFNHQGALANDAMNDILGSTCGIMRAFTGGTDALAWPGTAVLKPATGIDAATLSTPVSGSQDRGGDDGCQLLIIDGIGAAHTVTTAANIIVNSKKTLTFNGTIGSFVKLIAYAGIWYVLQSSGVTVS